MKTKFTTTLLSALLTVVMLLSVVPLGGLAGLDLLSTKASALNYEMLEYEIRNGEVTIIGCDRSVSGELAIPSKIDGCPVTMIEDNAFTGCIGLTNITIPDSVTSIGTEAFIDTALYNDLSNWKNKVLYVDNCLIIADDSISGYCEVKSGTRLIADFAFANCTELTSITISNSVTSIAEDAFSDCAGLTRITVASDNKNYSSDSYGVLYNKDKTELIYYPLGNSRATFTIPNSVKSIGNFAFYGVEGRTDLTSITIPDGVTSIGYSAFDNCTSLTSITIPDSVTSIGYSAFANCTSLTSITIPESVASIGDNTFYGCTALTNITIPDSVTSIGEDAFVCCTALTSITIPDSVTSIGDSAFYGCTALTNITIPDSVTSIGRTAFYNCTGLTSVTIGNSVTSIGNSAFEYCTALTSITIPNSVTSIGESAFIYCSGLKSVTIGYGVKNIGNAAFNKYFYNDEEEYEEISNFTIHCYDNTEGLTYAKRNEIKHEIIAFESIRIASTPTITKYKLGTNISNEGIKIIAKYSDGLEVDVTEQVRVTEFNTRKLGSHTAKVEFEGKTATFEYNVSFAWWQLAIVMAVFALIFLCIVIGIKKKIKRT